MITTSKRTSHSVSLNKSTDKLREPEKEKEKWDWLWDRQRNRMENKKGKKMREKKMCMKEAKTQQSVEKNTRRFHLEKYISCRHHEH